MNTRSSMLATVAAVIALALGAAALGMVLARPQPLAAATTDMAVRHITVIGTGDVNAAPDTAQVQVGVQTQADSAQEALTQNNSQMTALIDQLKQLGIAERDIQTSNVSIWPRYGMNGTRIEGYEANNTVTVKIRDITQTGELLDNVVEVGANNVSGIGFTIDDPSALETEARNAAIADARARAEAMAQAIGGAVGQVLNITESIGSVPPPMYEQRMMAADTDGGSVPVQPGEQTITAQVQVTFELR